MQEDSGGEGLLRTLALAVEAIWPSYVHWKQICDMMIDLQPFEIILGTSVVERILCRQISQWQASESDCPDFFVAVGTTFFK